MSATHPIDRTWKTLAHALTERVDGLEAAAAVARVGKSSLGFYQNYHHEQVMPVDVAATLERIAGEPLMTAELARRAGYALVPVHPIAGGQLAEVLARLGKEVGEVFGAFAQAMADGHATDDERAVIARELQDVISASHNALATLQGQAR